MTALLRYAFLKSARDGSLAAFILGPVILIVAALGGSTVAQGFRYPFFIYPEWNAHRNAAFAGTMVFGTCLFFAGIAAFWTFRTEIATKTVGTFILAARPVTVILSVIAFGVAAGLAGWAGATGAVGVLTSALPPHLGSLAVKAVAGCLVAAAAGALMVTISAQPQMVIWSYCSCALLVPVIVQLPAPMRMLVAMLTAILFAGLSTFLLVRRCAT